MFGYMTEIDKVSMSSTEEIEAEGSYPMFGLKNILYISFKNIYKCFGFMDRHCVPVPLN